MTASLGGSSSAGLEHDLDNVRLLMAITKMVARDASAWLGEDDAALDLVIDDVVDRWNHHARHQQPNLTAFWNQYANKIEFDNGASGNEYRAEFCPAREDAPFDMDDYLRAVWADHVATLRKDRQHDAFELAVGR